MKIKFWGVRGSIACPGPLTVKYGGNTLCVELYFEELKRRIIIDAGTGIRELGNHLMQNGFPKNLHRTEIFLTHTHWDHIQGFPFFTPIYFPDTTLRVYGPVTYEDDSLESILGGQWVYRYFPVRQVQLAAAIEYIDLKESSYDLGDGIQLTTRYLNHPLLCLGYRFEYAGKAFCTAYDTEPYRNVFSTNPEDPAFDASMAQEAERMVSEENQRLETFFAGADLLVHDTQYTQAEYMASRLGWGHSSYEHAVAAATRSKVKRLALFHHEPGRTDAELDRLAEVYCRSGQSGDTAIFFAREGMEIEL